MKNKMKTNLLRAALLVFAVLFGNVSHAADAPLLPAPGPTPWKLKMGPAVTSSGEQVRKHRGPYTGTGFIVASPINSGETGVLYPTYEVHVNQGRFPDDPTYLGSNFGMSIDERNHALFKKFRDIENQNHRLFVFEYDYKSHWNPEIEDTHYFLKNIYTVEEFLDLMQAHNLPKKVTAKKPWDGSKGTKKKVGRIVDVERSGLIGNFCAVEVNLGGLSGGKATVESLVTLAVTEEDVCAWVEKAMVHGRDVEVDVNEDVWETWQPSSMFISAIGFKDEVPNPGAPARLEAGKLSNEQYQDLKERLLKDPEFLQRLINGPKR